jgi:hypothetical protein
MTIKQTNSSDINGHFSKFDDVPDQHKYSEKNQMPVEELREQINKSIEDAELAQGDGVIIMVNRPVTKEDGRVEYACALMGHNLSNRDLVSGGLAALTAVFDRGGIADKARVMVEIKKWMEMKTDSFLESDEGGKALTAITLAKLLGMDFEAREDD